jgi:hypothetical protein
MDKKLISKSNMVKGVLLLLNNNADKLKGVPALEGLMAKLTLLDNSSDEKTKAYLAASNGVIENRDSIKGSMKEVFMPVSSGLASWAKSQKLVDLRKQVRMTDSRYDAMPVQELVHRAKILIELAVKHKEGIANYGITSDLLAELKKWVDLFSLTPGAREENVAVCVSLHQSIVELLREESELLAEEMDDAMRVVRKNDRELYKAYRSARKLRKAPPRHNPPPDPTPPPPADQ